MHDVGFYEDSGGTVNSCDDGGVNVGDIISCAGGSLEKVDSEEFWLITGGGSTEHNIDVLL